MDNGQGQGGGERQRTPRIYCGSASYADVKAVGTICNVKMRRNDLDKLYERLKINTEKGWPSVKFSIMKRREPDKYGATHYCIVDEWFPNDKYLARCGIGKNFARTNPVPADMADNYATDITAGVVPAENIFPPVENQDMEQGKLLETNDPCAPF